jgi:methyl-accepting chemotaxis protein
MQISIRIKFAILLFLFIGVMVSSKLAIFWINSEQENQGLYINLAGKQRMLSQKMTSEATTIAWKLSSDISSAAYIDETRQKLSETAILFDSTLKALTLGGEVNNANGSTVTLSSATAPEIQIKLREGLELWDIFYEKINIILDDNITIDSPAFKSAISYIEENNAALLSKMDNITTLYQLSSEATLLKLEWLQLWTLIIILLGALIAFIIFGRMIVTPLSSARDVLERISTGDLTGKKLVVSSTDEIAQAVEAINTMSEGLQKIITEIRESSNDLYGVSEDIKTSSDDLSTSANEQSDAIRKASKSIQEMNTSVVKVAGSTSTAADISEELSSSVLEITASIDEVATISEGLSSTVEEVSSSITEMAASVKEITGLAAGLSSHASDTATAITEIDASIKEVENNLKTSAKLSEATATEAGIGREAVKETTDAMEQINSTVEDVANVIKRFVDKTAAVADILNVINEMTEQTNLLSLNAAIIAAQAGEHGKGFAVVADEIKDFSDRTAASSKQIEKLIKSVQLETTNAVKSVEAVGQRVEAGVDLSRNAADALDKILSSANSSSQMVEQIAKASAEQLRGSQQVTQAMEKITDMLSKVHKAIADQAKGSAYIAKASEKMMESATQAKRATKEQSHGGSLISKGIENISDMISSINKSTHMQANESQSLVNTINQVKGSNEKNILSIGKTKKSAEVLITKADALLDVVKQFKV